MVDDDEAALAAARDGHPAATAPITRSDQLGPAARPVAVPDDMSGPKATGAVTLPLHVYWSGPDPEAQVWDLDDRRQRAHLYEIVLREGTVADVRHSSTSTSSPICGTNCSCPSRYAGPGSAGGGAGCELRPRFRRLANR